MNCQSKGWAWMAKEDFLSGWWNQKAAKRLLDLWMVDIGCIITRYVQHYYLD